MVSKDNSNFAEGALMDIVLFFIYLVVLALQIALLVLSIKKRTKPLWISLFSLELVPMGIAAALGVYYDGLPGYGFMPGLSYLGEILFSYGAAVIYGVTFLVSVCACIICTKNNYKS